MADTELLALLHIEGPLERLEEALTHPSYANEQRYDCPDNQRLEFLGDAVLGLVVGQILMEQLLDANEGRLSLIRSQLVSAEALARWARSVDLGQSLRLGRGADAAGERGRDNVLADAVEALVGAMYLDRGIEGVLPLVEMIVDDPLRKLRAGTYDGRDAKSALQERVQSSGGASPRYFSVHTEGPDHKRSFVVEVRVDERVLAQGRGSSKKLAEQDAARNALATLEAESPPGEPR